MKRMALFFYLTFFESRNLINQILTKTEVYSNYFRGHKRSDMPYLLQIC
jgi:hypothetical protein